MVNEYRDGGKIRIYETREKAYVKLERKAD